MLIRKKKYLFKKKIASKEAYQIVRELEKITVKKVVKCTKNTCWVPRTPTCSLKCFKGTNGHRKTYEIFHVYCIFYSGFMCQTTVIFGITKNGSLESNNLASWNSFTCRNLFKNGANDMSVCLTFETAFCKKAQNFV